MRCYLAALHYQAAEASNICGQIMALTTRTGLCLKYHRDLIKSRRHKRADILLESQNEEEGTSHYTE